MGPKKGFTLIELLVVISIIALLLSILMPALGMVKDKARFVVCKTNLKQYSIAMAMYLSECDDKYPNSHYSIFHAQSGTYADYRCLWHDAGVDYDDVTNQGPLYSYLSPKVHLCPVSVRFAKQRGHVNYPNDPTPMEPVYSYSQNNYLGGYKNNKPVGVLKSSAVRSASSVVLFAEETLWTMQEPFVAKYILNDTCFMPRHPKDGGFEGGDSIATYHQTSMNKPNEGVGNAIFIDGHVELVDPKIQHEYSWGKISNSFKSAWPKGQVGSDCPY